MAQEFFCGHPDDCIASRYNICRVEMTLRPQAGFEAEEIGPQLFPFSV